VPDHVDVVHDLLADVHRPAIDAQGTLDRVDRAFHAGAVAAGPRKEDSLRHHSHRTRRGPVGWAPPSTLHPRPESPARRSATETAVTVLRSPGTLPRRSSEFIRQSSTT